MSSALTRCPFCQSPTAVCSNCIPGVDCPGGYVCCKASCGECGGGGCPERGLESDCCVTKILADGDACADTHEAPCYIGDRELPFCENVTGQNEAVSDLCSLVLEHNVLISATYGWYFGGGQRSSLNADISV